MLHSGHLAGLRRIANYCSSISVGVVARLTSERSCSVRMLHCSRAKEVVIQMPSRWAIWVLGVSFKHRRVAHGQTDGRPLHWLRDS